MTLSYYSGVSTLYTIRTCITHTACARTRGVQTQLGPSTTVAMPDPDESVKLELVLDLDHTCVHAAEVHGAELYGDAMPVAGVFPFFLQHSSHGILHEKYYKMRVRDGLSTFLREVLQFSTVHVYTMGSKSHARNVLDVIDPHMKFQGKTLCRQDGDDSLFEKSLSDIFPDAGAEQQEQQLRSSRAVVLDDREDAWCTASRPHVLQCTPFRYWREDGSPIPPPVSSDTTLIDLLQVLRGVHSDLARGLEPSAAASLASRRRRVLDGAVIVFAGGLLQDTYQLSQNAPWRLAESLGAECLERTDWKRVTHVVSGKGTANTVGLALESGMKSGRTIYAVRLQWLNDCAARWTRQKEEPYLWTAAAADSDTGSSWSVVMEADEAQGAEH